MSDRTYFSENPEQRAQEIRAAALTLAVNGGIAMGRMGGPLPLAVEFEAYIRGGDQPAPARAANVTTRAADPDAGNGDGTGDFYDTIATADDKAPPEATAASLRQGAKKK